MHVYCFYKGNTHLKFKQCVLSYIVPNLILLVTFESITNNIQVLPPPLASSTTCLIQDHILPSAFNS